MSRTGFAKDVLQQFIARIERLNEERESLSADIREVFAEAKGSGFDCKIMRKVIAFRKLDKADFQEQEAMIDLYMGAVGFDTTPLAKASSGGTKQNAPSRSNRDVSTDGEPSSEAGPQAQASHVGTDSEMLADHEGHFSEGVANTDAAVATDRHSDATPPLHSVKAMSAPPYPLHGFDIGEIPASLDRRERAPPQPSA